MPQQSRTKIDFAKYRTPQLFDAIMELLDWRGVMASGIWQALAACVVIGLSVSGVLCLCTYYLLKIDFPVFLAVLFWVLSIPCSFPASIFYAIAHLLNRSVANMLLIVDLLLETTKTVAKDIHSLRKGETALPTARELVEGVYLEVFLPIIEQVISGQLGVLGTPVLFCYRLTFGRLMRTVIKLLPDRAMAATTGMGGLLQKAEAIDMPAVVDALDSNIEHIDAGETYIVGALDWTKQKVKTVGGYTKFMIMLPCYVVAGVVILANVIIMIAVWSLLVWVFAQAPTSTAHLPATHSIVRNNVQCAV